LTAFDFEVNAWEPFAVVESREQTIIDQVADRLTRKYPSIPPDTLTDVVRDAHARFDGRRFAAKELDRRSLAGRPAVSTHGDSGTEVVESDSVC
jgi:hypothetical protein